MGRSLCCSSISASKKVVGPVYVHVHMLAGENTGDGALISLSAAGEGDSVCSYVSRSEGPASDVSHGHWVCQCSVI